MRRTAPIVGFLTLFCCAFPAVAHAQRTFWGLTATVSPAWRADNNFKVLYLADALALEGSEFRIGFVRGRTYGGEWGVLFVRKAFKEGGTIQGDNGNMILGSGVRVTGVEVEKFGVFGTIRDRVQIGMLVAGGVGTVSGTATEAFTGSIDARNALQPFGQDLSVHPLFRLELAGAVIGTQGFKVRVSGGFDWPGTARFAVGGVYFFGDR